MPIKVALNHKTVYNYDRLITLGPQVIRLRPAPHARTPIDAYSLTVEPANHFINWQQDPHGNFLARLVFAEKTDRFSVSVDVIADMTVINPFDFFLEEEATEFPFEYADELKLDLKPFLEPYSKSANFIEYRKSVDVSKRRTISFLIDLNQFVYYPV